jgi:hypothetical protein
VIEYLPSKCKVLSSNLSTVKRRKERKKEKERKEWGGR